jgi:hypothetical protein
MPTARKTQKVASGSRVFGQGVYVHAESWIPDFQISAFGSPSINRHRPRRHDWRNDAVDREKKERKDVKYKETLVPLDGECWTCRRAARQE